jgi:hypothetical protein
VSLRDNEFTLTGYFNPTEGGIDNVCSRRPVLVSVLLKRGHQELDAKELRILDDFHENVREQTYTLNRKITLQAQ